MYVKDFDSWNKKKKDLDRSLPIGKQKKQTYFNEREIWWAYIGQNIGFEVCGKGDYSTRPVLIIKKFSQDSAIIVPLSTKSGKADYFFSLGKVDKVDAYASISQLRVIDTRRLIIKIESCENSMFLQVKKKLQEFFL